MRKKKTHASALKPPQENIPFPSALGEPFNLPFEVKTLTEVFREVKVCEVKLEAFEEAKSSRFFFADAERAVLGGFGMRLGVVWGFTWSAFFGDRKKHRNTAANYYTPNEPQA